MACETCAGCLRKAIETEEALGAYYAAMAGLFPAPAKVHDLLLDMSHDEGIHASVLRQSLERGYHSEDLHLEAPRLLQSLEGLLHAYQAGVRTLPASFEEVYQFAHEQENTELNAIFTFLISRDSFYRGERLTEALALLQSHIEKINRLAGDTDRTLFKFMIPVSGGTK